MLKLEVYGKGEVLQCGQSPRLDLHFIKMLRVVLQ